MNVLQIYTRSPLRNFTYLIGNSDQEYWCIDPFDGAEIAQQLQAMGASLKGIINTHEHDDHTCGNNELLRLMDCSTVAGHPDCGSEIPGFSQPLHADNVIPVDPQHQLRVMDTPGHSRGHVCLLLESTLEQKALAVFSGDILFNAGVGHCRKPGANVKELYTTLSEQFYCLDDRVTVYPGHEYLENNLQFTLSLDANNQAAQTWLQKASGHDWDSSNIVTTIGDERQFNSFFRLQDSVIRAQLDKTTAEDPDVFIALRSRRDNW